MCKAFLNQNEGLHLFSEHRHELKNYVRAVERSKNKGRTGVEPVTSG
jgi:hypothetical protein